MRSLYPEGQIHASELLKYPAFIAGYFNIFESVDSKGKGENGSFLLLRKVHGNQKVSVGAKRLRIAQRHASEQKYYLKSPSRRFCDIILSNKRYTIETDVLENETIDFFMTKHNIYETIPNNFKSLIFNNTKINNNNLISNYLNINNNNNTLYFIFKLRWFNDL